MPFGVPWGEALLTSPCATIQVGYAVHTLFSKVCSPLAHNLPQPLGPSLRAAGFSPASS